MKKYCFEVCANSLQSAIAAQKGGADRIELCAQLDAGGITPSAATIKLTVKHVTIPVFVLIRPRSGNFVCDKTEFAIMRDDIIFAKETGAAGVVIGLLKPDGEIDIDRTSELVNLARPMQVTFHRAFDRTPDPEVALEDIIRTGADRILTSGQKKTALSGKELLKTLVDKAGGRIIILAGAGITPVNVTDIIAFSGVTEVHASCSVTLNRKPGYVSDLDTENSITVTDEKIVNQITSLLKNHSKLL